jgi:hypothetical protein
LSKRAGVGVVGSRPGPPNMSGQAN